MAFLYVPRTIGTVACIAALGVLFEGPLVRACSVSYTLWTIRTKSADPLFRFVRNGKRGYIDASGRVIIKPTLPIGDMASGEFHEGLMGPVVEHGQYVDRSGKPVFRTDASHSLDFSEGLAPASVYAGFAAEKWGFIDRTGNFAIPAQYDRVTPFSEGLARVTVSSGLGTTGYIDNHGQFVMSPHLTYGSDFHEDRAAVIFGGPCRITNAGSCQRPSFRPTETNAAYDCRYSFVDKTGTAISSLRFDDAMDFSEGLAPVQIDGLWGFVDRSGQISIPPRFTSVDPFSEGMATAAENGKVGYIDHSGAFVIRPQFEFADSFSDNRAVVSRADSAGRWLWRYIDKSGNPAFAGVYSDAASFSHGLASVTLDKKGTFAWIDTTGRIVLSYVGR